MTYISIIISVLLLFCFIGAIQYKIKKGSKERYSLLKEYFDNESYSNFVKKKELPDSLYIKPDMKKFPIDKDISPHSYVGKAQSEVLKLAETQMIKLPEKLTNAQVKNTFGTANLEVISLGEEIYSHFLHALINWSQGLMLDNKYEEGAQVLEEAIKIGCDISKAYTLLGEIYVKLGDKDRFSRLCLTCASDDFMKDDKITKNKIQCFLNDLQMEV